MCRRRNSLSLGTCLSVMRVEWESLSMERTIKMMSSDQCVPEPDLEVEQYISVQCSQSFNSSENRAMAGFMPSPIGGWCFGEDGKKECGGQNCIPRHHACNGTCAYDQCHVVTKKGNQRCRELKDKTG